MTTDAVWSFMSCMSRIISSGKVNSLHTYTVWTLVYWKRVFQFWSMSKKFKSNLEVRIYFSAASSYWQRIFNPFFLRNAILLLISVFFLISHLFFCFTDPAFVSYVICHLCLFVLVSRMWRLHLIMERLADLALFPSQLRTKHGLQLETEGEDERKTKTTFPLNSSDIRKCSHLTISDLTEFFLQWNTREKLAIL